MNMDFCTCTDHECPFHPVNHDKGCTPCILKNQKEAEVPSCLFKMVGRSERCEGYHFEDFAVAVVDAQRAAGEVDVIARVDAASEARAAAESADVPMSAVADRQGEEA